MKFPERIRKLIEKGVKIDLIRISFGGSNGNKEFSAENRWKEDCKKLVINGGEHGRQ